MVINRRLNILKHYLNNLSTYTYCSLWQVLQQVFSPTSGMVARHKIKHVSYEDEYVVYQLKGLNRPLYWPRKFSHSLFYWMISETFRNRDPHFYEIPETTVHKGDIVADCGAADDLFSLTLLGRVKHCYLIEPLLEFQQALNKTFSCVRGFEILPVALGEQPGKLYLKEASIMSTIGETGSRVVDVETIDRLFYARGISVDYLKVDIEGSEMSMLKGAANTIRQSRPRIAMALYHQNQNVDETVAFLQSLVPNYQYRLKGICAESGNPVMGHFWVG